MFSNLPFLPPGYGGNNTTNQDPQKAAAAGIKAGSNPSLLQMQDAMGGLLTPETMQQAVGGLFGDLKGDFTQSFNDLGAFATNMFGNSPARSFFNQLTGQTPQQPAELIPDQGILQPPAQPVVEPPPPPKEPVAEDDGWGNVKTDNDAIQWALMQGKISPSEAQWLMRWQAEAGDGNNWVDGSGGTKGWDYMGSGLTDQNKRIVDKFYNAVSGNWGGSPAGGQQQTQSNLLNVNPRELAARGMMGSQF